MYCKVYQLVFNHWKMTLFQFLVFFILSNFSCVCLENETCLSESPHQWGQRTYYKTTQDDFFPVEEDVLGKLKHANRRSEPSSGMVKLMIDFLMKDLVDLQPSTGGYLNIATPTLDLSNLKQKLKGK